MRADLATVPGSHAPAINAVVERFDAYFKSASALEAEAERMADDLADAVLAALEAGD